MVTHVIIKLTTPLNVQTTNNLFNFWSNIFGPQTDPDIPKHVFTGSEARYNSNATYFEKQNEVIASTCVLTVPIKITGIGGLAEVATDPLFRRKGLASKLCSVALQDFQSNDGEALFLGTGNPEAARIYHQLGWRKITGANVMVNITSNISPEEYLTDRFTKHDKLIVELATPIARIPMIPLLINPHDWHVLDVNCGMFSTKYGIQNSCMGLYRRYSHIRAHGNGEWFTASTIDGKIVGISSAYMLDKNVCRVDGFSHKTFEDCWSELIDMAIQWGSNKGAVTICANLSVQDEEKHSFFSNKKFTNTGRIIQIQYSGRQIESIELARPTI